MGGGSKSTTQTGSSTSTSQTTPYAPAQGSINDMIAQAAAAYHATPKTPIFSGPNQDQTNAVNYLRTLAPITGQGADTLRQLGMDTAAGKFLDPKSNPFISAAVAAANSPAQEAFGKNIVSIGDAATMAGAYGGDRQALLKSQSLQDLNQITTNNAAQMYGANYANERALQQNAGALLGQANTLSLEPAKILAGVGDQQQSWTMAQIAAAQQAPWTGLDNWAQILGTVAPYGTSSGTSQYNNVSTGPQPSQAQGALGGALGGAAAGSAFGPWGAAIGGVVGGLGGLFG